MAKKQKPIEYEYIDDLTGQVVEAGDLATVQFSLNGRDFTIDLSRENADRFDEVLRPYINAASPARRSGTSTSKKTRSTASPKSIREWGNKNGYPSERGPLRKDLIAAYNATYGEPA